MCNYKKKKKNCSSFLVQDFAFLVSQGGQSSHQGDQSNFGMKSHVVSIAGLGPKHFSVVLIFHRFVQLFYKKHTVVLAMFIINKIYFCVSSTYVARTGRPRVRPQVGPFKHNLIFGSILNIFFPL